MVRSSTFLIFMIYQTNVNLACHSLSSQYNQFPSRRARARGVSSLEKTSENAIDFDYFASNLPYSATEIRSMSSLTPIPNEPLLTVSDGGKLTCNFDDEMEYCGWHNAENSGKGNLTLRIALIISDLYPVVLWLSLQVTVITKQLGNILKLLLDNNFLMAGGEPMVDSKTAALEMEIPCQYGDADVKFDCQLLQRVSNPLNFSIPTTVDELRVRIEVTNIDGDSIALIDNLHYNGQICELIDEATEHSLVSFNGDSSSVPSLITGEPSTDPTVQKFFEEDSTTSEDTETTSTFGLEIKTSTASSKSTTSHVNVKELSFCSALTCSFNDGDSCFYGLSGVGSTSTWILSDRLIGNRHTGIQRLNLDDQSKGIICRDGIKCILISVGFAYVGKTIVFFFKVCFDNFENCPYISPPVRKNKFWLGNQNVTLKEGSKKVINVVLPEIIRFFRSFLLLKMWRSISFWQLTIFGWRVSMDQAYVDDDDLITSNFDMLHTLIFVGY
ncbi:hypothetical protein CAEBREN_01949 [Caenorhabditis brenneri]|uniref:MAM domain-containing protein n=1 Tax=Caenorhabditis brenneri TaxID=135651 RepID=G0MXF4_CAEBE|nr:hypothetical protein CAEBREN_01949 [Caenorhabditis brenneri]